MDERQTAGNNRLANLEYRYLTEFQSHEPEFDYLKSLEIEEKINQVQWVNHNCGSRLILSTNDKTVKLWKVRLPVKLQTYCLNSSPGNAAEQDQMAAVRRVMLCTGV